MKVFVAGATGAIGRPLITQLLTKGYDVTALTHSPERAKTLAEQGVEPAIADVFDIDAVKAAILRAQPEVVIEQLTALPKTYTSESIPSPQISVEEALQIGDATAVHYGTQMRGASNSKAKRELGFQPRSLEWIVESAGLGCWVSIWALRTISEPLRS